MPSHPKHITILGAGLSGLSTAYHVSHLLPSTKVTIVEASQRVGGWIESLPLSVGITDHKGSVTERKVTIETGPRTIRPRGSKGAAPMLKMLRDIGLEDSIIPVTFSHPSAKNRFLLDSSKSKLVALPSSALSILGRQPSLIKGLLASAMTEPLKSRPRSQYHTEDGDETVDSFFRRRFGNKVADNMASAMVHGIYAASSTQLSLRAAFPSLFDAERNYGSVLAGMFLGTQSKSQKAEEQKEWAEVGALGEERKKWSLYGIKGGLGTMTEKLLEVTTSRGVEVISGQKVSKISMLSDNGVEVHTPNHSIQTSHVISALPPRLLAPLLFSPLPNLTVNPYTSVGVINLIYALAPSQVHPAGFGYLVPRPSSGSLNPSGILGVIFDSTSLPSPEAEEGLTKLTIMMGGPYWSTYEPRLIAPSDPQELIPKAVEHLCTVFPHLKGVEPIRAIASIHRDCIPTYLPGHGARLRELHGAIKDGDWSGKLSLVGNGYGGVGVNDCVYSGREVARGLSEGKEVTGLEAWKSWE